MFDLQNRDQAKTAAQGKLRQNDSAPDRKDGPQHNPRWQSLAMRPVFIQAKLSVSQPNDPHEQEADRIAERVTHLPEPKLQGACLCGGGACPACQTEQPGWEHERLRPKRIGPGESGQTAAPPTVHEALASHGQPLDPATRAFMEPRFGYDFSMVRAHSGAAAGQSAQDLNAHAYTMGHDIVFGAGRFAPGTLDGQRLIAHELAHVVQQSDGVRAIQRQPASSELDGRAARARARWLAGRIRKHTKVSKEVRALIEHDMAFYKAGAKQAYIQELESALRAVGQPELIGKTKYVPTPVSTLSLLREDEMCGGQKCFSEEDLHLPEAAKGTEAASGLAPSLIPRKGSKELKKGRMDWFLVTTGTKGKGGPAARIQITFTAKPSYRSQTVTFLQTVLTTKADTVAAPTEETLVDMRTDIEELEPFYGADWDSGKKGWIAESVKTPVPQGNKNAPSSSADASAYLFDEPWLYPGMGKVFESVAVIPETGEILGSLRWGVAGDELLGARSDDCTDMPSAGFDKTMLKFYSEPRSDPDRPGRFDVIIDGFGPENIELSPDHERKLEPIIAKFLSYPKAMIAVSGFADTSEDDPSFVSEMRALIVQRHMMSKGVPQENIDVHSFGAAWARFPSSPSETRNRRVQVRLYYK